MCKCSMVQCTFFCKYFNNMYHWYSILLSTFIVLLPLQVTEAKFSCEGRSMGYYADVPSGCQVYHMCDGLGRQFTYTCPNATLFQQRMLICDHWYMVNCSKSEEDYSANLLIGQKEKLFVDDSDENPYHRTPRPDLLTQPTAAEYNIIYRTGRAHSKENFNIVGAALDYDNDTTSTDEPLYFLPSHWSTEYAQRFTTYKPPIAKEKDKKFVPTKLKFKPTESPINYKSNFKATTPVFPLEVEPTTVAPDTLGILPPLLKNIIKNMNNVNFKSNFMATTPVYPLNVEATSVDPGNLGVLPPKDIVSNILSDSNNIPSLNIDFLPPKSSNQQFIKKHEEKIIPSRPSKFYQPPKFDPDYTSPSTTLRNTQSQSLSIVEWDNLKKKFLIPDYQFPLETASRPSYDSVLNSFHVYPASEE